MYLHSTTFVLTYIKFCHSICGDKVVQNFIARCEYLCV